MKDSYKNYRVIENTEISKGVYKLVVEGKSIAKPGQFYMLKSWDGLDPFLPRPLSISDIKENKLIFLYEVVGRGTDIFSKLKRNDELSMLGPLGNGFNIEEIRGKVALVSGGAGIAPMLYLSKRLNAKIDLYAGYRDVSYYTNEFIDFVENINISTETGKEGYKGYIIDILDSKKYDYIISCGPTPMIKAIAEKCSDKTELIVSMENRMACGIGACLGCNIETIYGNKRVCKEGPIFNSKELIFND